MDWRQHIHSNPEVLMGKPVLKGTRLSVVFLLNLLSTGWTYDQIKENYPVVTDESLSAIFAFAAECVQDENVYLVETEVA